MTGHVTRGIATTLVALTFIAALADLTLRDAIAAGMMIFPFAFLIGKYVIRNS
jgi:hypothetical protein